MPAHRTGARGREEPWAAVVIGASTLLLVLGMAFTLGVASPMTGPNLQTVGLVISLIGLTALTVVLTIRDPVD